MCFICQINLEELHAQAADATDLNLLPRLGMLYFFAQIDYFLGWSRELEEGIGLWGKDDADGHKLLGRPFFDEVPSGTSLLQIDEDDDWGLRFFDSGMINFIMDSNSLAHKDFSKTELYFLRIVK